jgi:uncharacterized protein (DUF983 family)
MTNERMRFLCPACRAQLQGPTGSVGKPAACPVCTHEFEVPWSAPPSDTPYYLRLAAAASVVVGAVFGGLLYARPIWAALSILGGLQVATLLLIVAAQSPAAPQAPVVDVLIREETQEAR